MDDPGWGCCASEYVIPCCCCFSSLDLACIVCRCSILSGCLDSCWFEAAFPGRPHHLSRCRRSRGKAQRARSWTLLFCFSLTLWNSGGSSEIFHDLGPAELESSWVSVLPRGNDHRKSLLPPARPAPNLGTASPLTPKLPKL